MPKRPGPVTQADIARAIRAMKAEGTPRVRVILRYDGVEIVPDDGRVGPYERRDEVADEQEIVIL